MSRYAESTSVSVEKSQGEIRTVLKRYGADQIVMGDDDANGRSMVQFSCHNRNIRFILSLPLRNEKSFWFTNHAQPKRRNDQQAYESWEQACRSRWRALLLCIKAKLEAVECGISEFEEEFLAHIVLADNRTTVGQLMLPQIAKNYEDKKPVGGIMALIGCKPNPERSA